MIKLINGVKANFYNGVDEVPICNDYFFINEKILPKGISVSDIDDIIGRVSDFIYSFDNQIPHGYWLFDYRFGVRFSNEIPVRIYGHKTISDIKNELIDLLLERLNSLNEEESQISKKSYEDLIDRINKAVTTGDLMELASQIAEMLVDRHDDEYEENEKNQYEDLKEIVKDIIKSYSFELPILGSFNYVPKWKGSFSNSDSLEIVLYVNNIYNAKDNYGGLLNAYEAVIAHELFHYFHFCLTEISYYDYINNESVYLPWEFSQRNDYLSSVIKESFASYFEYLYCNANNIKNPVAYSWDMHSITVYPYSGAKFIKDENEFIDLINYSLEEGMDAALLKIVNSIKTYYNIINNKDVVYNKTMSNNSNNRIIIKAKAHYELLNKAFNLSLKGWSKTTYNLHGNKIWFIRIDGKFRNGYKNEFQGDDVIETSLSDHNLYKDKYRYIFQIVESNGNREYIYLGKYEYLVDKSSKTRSVFKCLYDYSLINSSAINVDLDVEENKVPNTFTNDVLYNINKNNTISLITVPGVNDARDTFAEVLEDIQEKKGLSKHQVCERCGIDKTQYNRLLGQRKISISRPSKETVYKICIGLELSYEEAMDLREKAGHYNCDYEDDLIEHCLKNSYYNKDEIDSTLKHYGYKPLFNTDTFDEYYKKNKDIEIDITKE